MESTLLVETPEINTILDLLFDEELKEPSQENNINNNKTEELNEMIDLLDLGVPNQTFTTNHNGNDLMDFGKMQANNDLDLLNPQINNSNKKKTFDIKASNKMFGDINTDLFDLSDMKKPANNNNTYGNSSYSGYNNQHQFYGASNGSFNMQSANTNNSKKKDLDINEFDFL